MYKADVDDKGSRVRNFMTREATLCDSSRGTRKLVKRTVVRVQGSAIKVPDASMTTGKYVGRRTIRVDTKLKSVRSYYVSHIDTTLCYVVSANIADFLEDIVRFDLVCQVYQVSI